MTKNQLQDTIYSAKLDLEHEIKQLQRRITFNDIERINTSVEDEIDPGTQMARRCGSFEAMVSMANMDMQMCISNLEKTLKKINN